MSDTYSFLDVNAAISGPGGVINLAAGAGVADEGITFAPAGDISSMTVGADGEGMHSLHADKSGRVTVRLLKTSPVNGLLATMYAFQTATPTAHGQNTIVLSDNRGDLLTARQVAFVRAPTLTYGKEAGMNEWEFDAVRIDRGLAK